MLVQELDQAVQLEGSAYSDPLEPHAVAGGQLLPRPVAEGRVRVRVRAEVRVGVRVRVRVMYRTPPSAEASFSQDMWPRVGLG